MCGVFGIFGHPEAANITYLGLHALQHRGQESAGIVTADGEQLLLHRGMGHVIDVFTPDQLAKLAGHASIGHVRYSTAGGSFVKNAQPIAVDYARGSMAFAHNGNLTNAEALRERLEARGSIFQTGTDTEVIVHLVAISTQRAVEDRVADALGYVKGAYSLVCLTDKVLIAVRDPHAIRPLCLGRMLDASHAHVVSSEPGSFDLIGAEFVRDLEPGEMLIIDERGMRAIHPFPHVPRSSCIFEYVYFARPDSHIDGISVYLARKNVGRALAKEHGIAADVVIPVPDSGVAATIGYAEAAGIPFEMGLVRSHYVGRTFIEPQQTIRHFGVKLKLNPVNAVLRGRRVVIVDDSIVRGTTSRKIVKMVRDAGAKEVHLRIASPPTAWPCYYGIDTPTRRELIASSHTTDEINQYITSDSVGYLSLSSLINAVIETQNTHANRASGGGSAARDPLDTGSFCHACWSGEYPVAFSHPPRQRQMRLLDT
ncbi:MAG: amidophosphoribosyltransferase [Polyangiaceae bacterium]|nr:amidophosphoribosyltransferase [Polyangiaceae bacterium]